MGDHDTAVRAGHISFEQAEAMAGRTGRAPLVGPRAAEVLSYFAAVALAVATLVLAYDVGFDRNPFAAIVDSLPFLLGGAALGGEMGDFDLIGALFSRFENIPAGLVTLAGAAILVAWGGRLAAHAAGAIRRAGGFTLFVGYVLSSVAFGFLLWDLDAGDLTPLVNVLPVAAVALWVWMKAPSVPTQLALFVTAVDLVGAILILIQADTTEWIVFLVGTALGLAWIWLGMTGRMRTRNAAFVLGAFYAWVNVIDLFGLADGWIVLSVALAAAFVWGATAHQSSVLGTFATIATAVLIAQFVSLLVDEPSTRTWILAYGIPGLLALGGSWWLTQPGPTGLTPALPAAPPAPTPPPAPVAPSVPETPAKPPAAARTTTAAKKPTTTTAKKPATTKTTTTAKKPATTKTTTTAKKPTTTKTTTTAKKPATTRTTTAAKKTR